MFNPKVSIDKQTQAFLTGIVGRICSSLDALTAVVDKKEIHAELHVAPRRKK